MPPRIEGLVWTEKAEEHVEAHIGAWEIDELIERGDFSMFRNTAGHPPNRWRCIGRNASGGFITAILEEPFNGDPTQWRPVTGWRSTPFEREMYGLQRSRQTSKRRKSHD